MTKEDYKKYLRSSHWKRFKRRFWENNTRICHCCKGKSGCKILALHHITYDRIGGEKLTDVIAVCNDCHLNIHRFHEENEKLTLEEATTRYTEIAKILYTDKPHVIPPQKSNYPVKEDKNVPWAHIDHRLNNHNLTDSEREKLIAAKRRMQAEGRKSKKRSLTKKKGEVQIKRTVEKRGHKLPSSQFVQYARISKR